MERSPPTLSMQAERGLQRSLDAPNAIAYLPDSIYTSLNGRVAGRCCTEATVDENSNTGGHLLSEKFEAPPQRLLGARILRSGEGARLRSLPFKAIYRGRIFLQTKGFRCILAVPAGRGGGQFPPRDGIGGDGAGHTFVFFVPR